jgi:hypothetical protein
MMSSAAFILLLCVSGFATIFVTSGVFTFHESDAAGQGLAHVFVVIADIVLLLMLGGLMLICGFRGAFAGGWGVAALALYLAAAAAEFGAVAILAELRQGDRFETLLRLLVPAIPVLLIAFAVIHFFGGAPSAKLRLGVALSLAILSAISFVTLVRAKSASNKLRQAEQLAWAEAQQKALNREAEVRALPADTPLASVLKYAEDPLTEDNKPMWAAIERIRTLRGRQAQVERALAAGDLRILPMLSRIDLEVTPQVCDGARLCLRKFAATIHPSKETPWFASVENIADWYTLGAGFLLKNGCDCKQEIGALEQNVRLFPDPYPKKYFLDHLLEMQGKPRE